jgi:hypothetical protein
MAGISDQTYERLRLILEKQNNKTYTLEEAKEIGDGLLAFFTLLIELSDQGEKNQDAVL